MQIGEISKRSELTRDTIRFYEKKGLIKVERTTSVFNNYKNYTLEHLNRLLLIKKAKRFGFTLNEIAELLLLVDGKKAKCSILQEKVNKKITAIDKRIQELKDIKNLILDGVQKAQVKCSIKSKANNCQFLEQ